MQKIHTGLYNYKKKTELNIKKIYNSIIQKDLQPWRQSKREREREREMCDINTHKADPSCIRPAYAMQCMELPEPGCLLPSRFTYLQKIPKYQKQPPYEIT